MLLIHGLLPRRQQTRLEPRRITEDMLKRVGLRDDLDRRERLGATVAAHFAYGTAAAAPYLLVEPFIPLPKGLRGAGYGLAVWAASYAGWLPAIGTLPPPHRRPRGRNVLLIASHLVWGAATEVVTNALHEQSVNATRQAR
jgi:uncharacterized membrane protein YagU involved in acid resistance